MPVEMAGAISTWRPVARDADEVLDKGVAFLRNKADQYRLS
jgi:D-psicose/D-tagatose/L-ribulose 3-epimerase